MARKLRHCLMEQPQPCTQNLNQRTLERTERGMHGGNPLFTDSSKNTKIININSISITDTTLLWAVDMVAETKIHKWSLLQWLYLSLKYKHLPIMDSSLIAPRVTKIHINWLPLIHTPLCYRQFTSCQSDQNSHKLTACNTDTALLQTVHLVS